MSQTKIKKHPATASRQPRLVRQVEDREQALAAACYLNHYVARAWVHDPAHDVSQGLEPYAAEPTPDEWPDSEGWYDGWEPSTPLEDLRLVLELVSAEIQRLEPNTD